MTIGSTVLERIRHERLAWDAHCNGVHAYHAWTFEKRDGGEYALTEEPLFRQTDSLWSACRECDALPVTVRFHCDATTARTSGIDAASWAFEIVLSAWPFLLNHECPLVVFAETFHSSDRHIANCTRI